MADYPNTITDPRVVANKPGTEYDAAKTTRLFAEDHNGLADEIVAIETELGTNPKGTATTVKERIENIETKTNPLSFLQNTKKESGLIFSFLTSCKLLLKLSNPTDAGTEPDDSGNGHDASYPDAANWSASNLSTVGEVTELTFDLYSKYLTVPDHADFSFGNGVADSAFSIGFFINVLAGTTSRCIINKYKGTTGAEAREWSIVLNSSEKIVAYFYDESSDKQPSRTLDNPLSDGTHFVVITYDPALGSGATFANGVKIYVDGAEAASTASNQALYVAMEDTTSDVYIGVIQLTSTLGNYLNGKLGRIFITKETLTALTIRKIYLITRGFYQI